LSLTEQITKRWQMEYDKWKMEDGKGGGEGVV